MCFYGGLMNYWSFLYSVSALLLQNSRVLFSLLTYLDGLFFFHVVFLFFPPTPGISFMSFILSLCRRANHQTILSYCAVYPCTLCVHLSRFPFKSPLSSLYIPSPPPLFSSQIISLTFYFYPFTSFTLSLAASNMVYSLSCFPECEECCCFRMSTA